MAEEVRINKVNVVKLATERFGTKPAAMHYLAIARDAASRGKAAMSLPNAVLMGAELQTISDALESLSNILYDEKANLSS